MTIEIKIVQMDEVDGWNPRMKEVINKSPMLINQIKSGWKEFNRSAKKQERDDSKFFQSRSGSQTFSLTRGRPFSQPSTPVGDPTSHYPHPVN